MRPVLLLVGWGYNGAMAQTPKCKMCGKAHWGNCPDTGDAEDRIQQAEQAPPDSLDGLTQRANAAHDAAEQAARRTLGKALECGSLLARIKGELPHGEFGEWVSERFKGSYRTARRFMRLHEHRDQIGHDGHFAIVDAERAIAGSESEGADKAPEDCRESAGTGGRAMDEPASTQHRRTTRADEPRRVPVSDERLDDEMSDGSEQTDVHRGHPLAKTASAQPCPACSEREDVITCLVAALEGRADKESALIRGRMMVPNQEANNAR